MPPSASASASSPQPMPASRRPSMIPGRATATASSLPRRTSNIPVPPSSPSRRSSTIPASPSSSRRSSPDSPSSPTRRSSTIPASPPSPPRRSSAIFAFPSRRPSTTAIPASAPRRIPTTPALNTGALPATPPASPPQRPPASPGSSPRRTPSTRHTKTPRTSPLPPLANVFSWAPESRTRFVELSALQSLLPPLASAGPSALELAAKLKEWEHDTLPDWRLLPGKVEREVADLFAFLAAADSGAEFIAAACVEERNGGGILFRLAMNEGVLNEGVPRRIVEGLEAVCRELVAASGDARSERKSREAVWEKVLDLEHQKIVKDLRQKFNRATKSLHELFQEAIARKKRMLELNPESPVSELSLLSGSTSHNPSLVDAGDLLYRIYDQCQDVANKEGGSDCRDEVERLLNTCYLARRSRGFKSLMANIEGRKQLFQTIDKFGRYKAASYSLVSIARKHPDAFKAIEIETVSPPVRESFALPENPETGLATIASQLSDNTVEEAGQQLKKLTGLTGPKLLGKYEELYLGRPNIHAEIQLVKFYEENPPMNLPKFIGSSKKSCHLCNLFLELHGRFTVSKASPNVYPRWTVPSIVCSSAADVECFQGVVGRLSSILEASCISSLCHQNGQSMMGRVNTAAPTALATPPDTPPSTPPLPTQSFPSPSLSPNASLRVRGSPKSRSTVSTVAQRVENNTRPTTPRRTRQSTPGMPTTLHVLPQQSMGAQDWTISPPHTPENIPLPPSTRGTTPMTSLPENISLPPSTRVSRVATPMASSRLSVNRPTSPPDEVGGVLLTYAPPLRAAAQTTRSNTPVQAPAAFSSSPSSTLSRASRTSRTKERRLASPIGFLVAAQKSGATIPMPSADSPAPSMEVQISKNDRSRVSARSRTPETAGPIEVQLPKATSPNPSTPKAPSTTKAWSTTTRSASRRSSTNSRTPSVVDVQSIDPGSPLPRVSQHAGPIEVKVVKVRSRPSKIAGTTSGDSSLGSTKSSTAATLTTTTTTSATSTSLPPTPVPSPAALERSRVAKGKFRAIAAAVAAASPRPNAPLGALNLTIERHPTPPTSPTPRSPWLDSPAPTPQPSMETGYTIYLAGNYSNELSLGDAVFSGKLSDINREGEMVQCRGFRLRSGLRKRRVADMTAKEAPLRVHEVVKTSEMMVLDIIFPDAVVRLEVFWDEEARSVVE